MDLGDRMKTGDMGGCPPITMKRVEAMLARDARFVKRQTSNVMRHASRSDVSRFTFDVVANPANLATELFS